MSDAIGRPIAHVLGAQCGRDRTANTAAARRSLRLLRSRCHRVKGFPEPVHPYQVVRESTIEIRFEALHGAMLTPLVGREEEIDLLLRQWHRAKRGEGQVVLLSGEPGIGNSRLIAALQ